MVQAVLFNFLCCCISAYYFFRIKNIGTGSIYVLKITLFNKPTMTKTSIWFKIYSIVLLTVIFVSCQARYTDNENILRAESLLETSPDSAFVLLSSIAEPQKMPKGDYAAWCLHYTHAQYKLYKTIANDSLIMVAVEYYRNSKLLKYSGTSYYLLGGISEMKGDTKKAMLAYKSAEAALKSTNENKLKGKVAFNIGYIYMQDELFIQSLEYFKKALRYYMIIKDIKSQAYTYRCISDVYNQLEYPYDSVIHYSNLAIWLSKAAGDTTNYYANLSRKGELMSNTDYKHSAELLLQGYKHLPLQQSKLAAFLSFTYSKMNKLDSAKYYIKVAKTDALSPSNTLLLLAEAYVSKGEGNQMEAFAYFEKAYLSRDSVYRQNTQNQLYRIDKQYDATQTEKENANLLIANANNQFFIAMLVILVLLGFVILLLIINRVKKQQNKHALEKQQLDNKINEKQSKIEQNRILQQSELQNKIDNTLKINRLKVGLLQQDKHAEFMAEITRKSVISEKECQYYIDEVNLIYAGKISRLEEKFTNLTVSDKIVIALIVLKVDITDCCSLLDLNQQALYTRRKRIKSRLNLDKDVDLDGWVIDYVSEV